MVQAMTIAELGERGLNSIRSVPDFVRRPSDNQWRTHDVNLPGPPGTPQGDYRPTSRPNTEWHPNGSSGQQGPPGGRPAYTHPSWTPPTQSTSAPSPPPPQLSTPATQCPAIWQTIIADLNKRFLGGNGQCTDDARAAIRVSYTTYYMLKLVDHIDENDRRLSMIVQHGRKTEVTMVDAMDPSSVRMSSPIVLRTPVLQTGLSRSKD
jgi:hypothetical protein